MLTLREAAHLLQVPPETIYQWIRKERLPAYRIKERYRFSRTDLLEWASTRKIPFRPELVHEPGPPGAPPASLREALEAGGVHYGVPGGDKASAIRSVASRIPLPSDVDRELAAQVLLAREGLGSTAIGGGFAVPHARNPIVFHVHKPLLTLCFLENAADFGAIDGVPVHTVFALVCPTVGAHLALLSRLSCALAAGAFPSLLKARAPRGELLAQAGRIDSAIAPGSRS